MLIDGLYGCYFFYKWFNQNLDIMKAASELEEDLGRAKQQQPLPTKH